MNKYIYSNNADESQVEDDNEYACYRPSNDVSLNISNNDDK